MWNINSELWILLNLFCYFLGESCGITPTFTSRTSSIIFEFFLRRSPVTIVSILLLKGSGLWIVILLKFFKWWWPFQRSSRSLIFSMPPCLLNIKSSSVTCLAAKESFPNFGMRSESGKPCEYIYLWIYIKIYIFSFITHQALMIDELSQTWQRQQTTD